MAQPNSPESGTQLQTLSSRRDEPGFHVEPAESHEENRDAQELEPVDRGRAAWRMLLSAFIFESLLWGKCKPAMPMCSTVPSYDRTAKFTFLFLSLVGAKHRTAYLLLPLGFPLSFGVFQNYYSQLPEYANQPYVSIIGTVASGISYMGAPIIIPFLKRTGRYRVYMIWVGCE